MRGNGFAKLVLTASCCLLLFFLGMLGWDYLGSATAVAEEPLIVHSGAALRPCLEEIAQAYEKETGKKLELRYGGSQTVMTNLEVTGQGDLFLPGDDSYIRLAEKKGLLAEVLPLAKMRVVLVARPGLEVDFKTLGELLQRNLKLAQTNPDAAAIGKLTREHLQTTGTWDKLKELTTVFTGNVSEAANAVQLGTVDAGFVWDVTAQQFPKLTRVDLPELKDVVARLQIAVVAGSARPTEALRFARFVAGRDRGLVSFTKFGFSDVEQGDIYKETPELVLYGGSMLRVAVEDTLIDFEKREGVKVSRVYNGCGILVGQMKAGGKPDVYFACDTQFMNQVKDHFDQPAVISSNQLVIVVPKGNPHDLIALKDLGKANLQVGVGHEQQCALGAITKETFITSGVYGDVRKNVKVEAPTGDLLVNQLRTGSLDAVVAYMSNTVGFDDIETVSVTGIPCSAPFQPVAVAKDTRYPLLARRLLQAFQTESSKERFKKYGFGWEWNKAGS